MATLNVEIESGLGPNLECSTESQRIQEARREARELLAMSQRRGEDLGAIRELIAIPPDVEAKFHRWAVLDPRNDWIESCLVYRRTVLDEWDRITAAFSPPTSPAVARIIASFLPTEDAQSEDLQSVRDADAQELFRDHLRTAERFRRRFSFA